MYFIIYIMHYFSISYPPLGDFSLDVDSLKCPPIYNPTDDL